jgi:hypothetical protein
MIATGFGEISFRHRSGRVCRRAIRRHVYVLILVVEVDFKVSGNDPDLLREDDGAPHHRHKVIQKCPHESSHIKLVRLVSLLHRPSY